MLKHFYKILLLVGFFVLSGTWNASAEIWGIHGNFWERNQGDWSSRNMSQASDGTWVYSGYFYQGNFGLQQKDDNDSQPTWWSDPSSNTTITPGQSKTLTTSGKDLWLGTAGYYTFKFNPSTKTLTLTSGLSETPLYILSNDSGSWVLDKATATLTSDNTYSGTYTGSLEITSENAHIIFSTKLADSKEGWSNLNSTRYVPNTKKDVTPPSFPYSGEITQATDGSYILSKGTYNFSVNLNTKAITITKEKEPEVVVPEQLYIIGYVNDNVFDPNTGIELNKNGDVFTGNFDLTSSNDDNFTYFSFTTALASDWDNMGTRYGANSDGTEVSSGTYDFTTSKNAFKAAPGNYDISIDFSTGKITVKKNYLFEYPAKLYLIGSVEGYEWIENNPIEMDLISKKGIFKKTENFSLPMNQAGFKFSAQSSSNSNSIDKTYGTNTNGDTYITFGEPMTLHETTGESVKGAFMWYAGGEFEITVSFEFEEPTVLVEAKNFVYPDQMYIYGNVNGHGGEWVPNNYVEMDGNKTGIYTVYDLAISSKENSKYGTITFASNDPYGADENDYSWSYILPRFATAAEIEPLEPSFRNGATTSIVLNTEPSEEEGLSISLPEGHYDVTFNLSNENGANPIATFFPASVAVALGLTSEDTSSQSGEITENDEIHMVTIKECVLLYVKGPSDDARVFYKLQNVKPLEKTETASRVAPYAEADETDGFKEALPNQDIGGERKTVTLDTDTQGELILYYEHEGITSQPRTYTFKVENGIPTSIELIEATEEGEAVYYNLQGVKVSNPTNGIFIKVAGGKSEKVYINR